MRFKIKRASRPGWEHFAEASTVDECLRDWQACRRVNKFTVDYSPWEGFEVDDGGHIVRDEHGIGVIFHSGVIEVTMAA